MDWKACIIVREGRHGVFSMKPHSSFGYCAHETQSIGMKALFTVTVSIKIQMSRKSLCRMSANVHMGICANNGVCFFHIYIYIYICISL